MSAAIVSLLCVVLLDYQTQAQMKVQRDPMMQVTEYRTPEEIYVAFRNRKTSRFQGLAIAELQSSRADVVLAQAGGPVCAASLALLYGAGVLLDALRTRTGPRVVFRHAIAAVPVFIALAWCGFTSSRARI